MIIQNSTILHKQARSGLHEHASCFVLRAVARQILHEIPPCCRTYGGPCISLEPKARLTVGLLWWVPPSLLPCMGPYGTNAESCQYPMWHVARATWGDVTNVPPAVSR